MKIVGIIGGVGSGKSAVLDLLESEFGAVVRKLDDVARNLQQRGGICYEKIVEHFGEEIIGADGELDRGKLAGIVFANEEELEVLNGIVHPSVDQWVEADILVCRERNVSLYVLESAILVETGYDAVCDEFWYIYTNEQVRRERLKASRGYSDEKIDQIILAQSSEETFRKNADHVIDNSYDFETTRRRIGELI